MSTLVRYLTTPDGQDDVPHRVRVNAAGQISVVDVITNICFLGLDNHPISSARQYFLTYCNRLVMKIRRSEVCQSSLPISGPGATGDPCHWSNRNVAHYTVVKGQKGSMGNCMLHWQVVHYWSCCNLAFHMPCSRG